MPASWFMGVPGIKIVAPATPADAKALLRAAIDDDNPVLFFEHKRLYGLEGEVNGAPRRLGEAAVVREGGDVTLVSAMRGVHECLAAAERLAATGIDAEVDRPAHATPARRATPSSRSVAKTNRVVVVEEGPLTGGWAGEVLAVVDRARRSATSTTPGGSRRPTRRCPTARRSRTRTSRARTASPPRSRGV